MVGMVDESTIITLDEGVCMEWLLKNAGYIMTCGKKGETILTKKAK